MKCPACEGTLQAVKAGNIELDVCKGGCGGIWFNRDELFKFDEKQEFLPDIIMKLQQERTNTTLDRTKLRKCPKCEDERLVKQFLDHKNEVEMDQCWTCSGVWLDPGEITTLRSQFDSFEDRKKAVNEYVNGQLEDRIGTMEQKNAENIAAYREETSTRFSAALYAFKQLLGLDDPYDKL